MKIAHYLILDLFFVLKILLTPGGVKSLIAENLILRQQLRVLSRKYQRSSNLEPSDRTILGICSLFIKPQRLPALAVSVAHSTILKFHRALVKRKYSRLFSNKIKKKPGPKGPSLDLIYLVLEFKKRNPFMGTLKISQILNEILDQKIDDNLVRRILKNHFKWTPSGGESWLSRLGNEKNKLWSLDFFRCESVTLKSYWVMVLMDQFSRKIINFSVHKGPLNGPVICQMFNLVLAKEKVHPKYLSTDNDPLFKYNLWKANLRIYEINEVKSVPHIPVSHPFVERLIGTVRREQFDRQLFWSESDLTKKLWKYQDFYNHYRSHQSLLGKTPGESRLKKIELNNYRWQSHCNGIFSIPVAA